MPVFVSALAMGAAAGLVGGLVGVGGGVVMIPLMVRFAGLRQREAHGTSLVALVFIGLAGAATYAVAGAVDLGAAATLTLPAIATAPAGARYAHALPERRLRRAFGVFLLAVAALLVAKPWIPVGHAAAAGVAKLAALGAAGALTGFVSGMMGVGGGSVMVPAMVLLSGFPQVLAQGTSLLAMVPAGASGARQHARLGNVVRRLVPGLVAGALLGAWAGSGVALRLPEGPLRLAFAAVVAFTGVRLLRAPRAAPPALP